MISKEERWLKNRVGRITASELGEITSASGKIIDTNIVYIRAKRWERNHGYALPVSSRTMEIGNETEPMIFEWTKANLDYPDLVYSKDDELGDIPIWIPEDAPYFGASPDAFTVTQETVFEFKTLVGNETTFFYMDEYTPFVEKKARVLKEHGEQIFGLFISNPTVKRVILVKYAPQRDDIMDDRDSPLAPWRGVAFIFERKDYTVSIEEMRQRVILINAMIDAPVDPAQFKAGEWVVENGHLIKKEPNKK